MTSTPSAEFVPIEGYVWCDVKGSIHDTPRQPTHYHQGTEFFDIYQDGDLCSAEDHHPVFQRESNDRKDAL